MEYYEHKLDPVGVRPEWLEDEIGVKGFEQDGHEFLGTYRARVLIWSRQKRVLIPADHWAVPALKQGFKPWVGGDSAPEDWEGGDVLLRNGLIEAAEERITRIKRWQHYPAKGAMGPEWDIIGYKPKATTEAKPDADTRLMAIIERIASNGVASMTDVRECEAIVAERRPVDPVKDAWDAAFKEYGIDGDGCPREHFLAELARRNLKIVEAEQ